MATSDAVKALDKEIAELRTEIAAKEMKLYRLMSKRRQLKWKEAE